MMGLREIMWRRWRKKKVMNEGLVNFVIYREGCGKRVSE